MLLAMVEKRSLKWLATFKGSETVELPIVREIGLVDLDFREISSLTALHILCMFEKGRFKERTHCFARPFVLCSVVLLRYVL